MSKRDFKPKKKHKGLIIFLVIFSILIVLPVGFIFGAFFTTETKPVSNTEIHYENVVSESFYKGLSGLAQEHPQIDFKINEEMFDGIMMAACEKINQRNFIPKMYCYINNNNYTFVIDLQASFFKTRVLLYTTLFAEGQGYEKTLIFKINGITLGRLPIPLNWVMGIMGNFINDNMLNNAFEQSGFHIKSDLAHNQLTYNRLTFREDVYNYVVKLGKENPYLNMLLEMFGNEEILNIKYEDGVTASFYLEKLQLPRLITPLDFTQSQLESHKTKITEWLNKGEDYLIEDNVSKMLTYLIRGYNLSSKDEEEGGKYNVQGYIDSLQSPIKEELTTYIKSINPATTSTTDFKGSYTYNGATNKPFEEYCAKANVEDPDVEANFDVTIEEYTLKADFTINTESLNNYLMREMNKAIGINIPITYKDEDNKWVFDYALIDNLFINFEKVEGEIRMDMYLTLNVSGVQICLTLVNNNIDIVGTETGDNPKIGKLNFDIKEAYFGVIPITNLSMLDEILKMVPSDGTFVYNKDDSGKRSFGVDLDKNINLVGDGKKYAAQFLKAATNRTPSVEEKGDFDNLKISFSK